MVRVREEGCGDEGENVSGLNHLVRELIRYGDANKTQGDHVVLLTSSGRRVGEIATCVGKLRSTAEV
jgi:hypothetical protein